MVGDLRMWLGRDIPATHADAQAAGHPHRAPGPPGRSLLSSPGCNEYRACLDAARGAVRSACSLRCR